MRSPLRCGSCKIGYNTEGNVAKEITKMYKTAAVQAARPSVPFRTLRKRRVRDHQDVQNGSSASGPAECAIPDAVTNTAADMMGLPMRPKKGTRPTEVFLRRLDPSAALNNLPGARLMFSPRWVRECVCRSGAGVTTATAVVGERLCACGCVYVGRCTSA
jgi:hypothetical protein